MQLSAEQQHKRDTLIANLSSRLWRLNNIYYIKDKDGRRILFQMNEVQLDFYKNMHYFDVILKARQMGFTTFINIFILDYVLWNMNKSAGIIAHTKLDAQALFKDKVKFAYDNLDPSIKAMVPAKTDNALTLDFLNGSSIRVGTSLRSGTLQLLHVSEYGKIAAKYPEKAKEIKTGAFNTISAGNFIFVESTAEGQEGEFYELTEKAKQLEQLSSELTAMDPKFFFYPWFRDSTYTLDGAPAVFPHDLAAYFLKVEAANKVELTNGQKYWYQKKQASQGEDMLREYPSTAEEAFQTSTEGSYYNAQLAYLRKNKFIGKVPWQPLLPVHTWWDLGMGDYTSIWFMQQVGQEYHFIDYYENNGEGLSHYKNYLASLPYTYGKHFWPHDAMVKELGTGKSRYEVAQSLGIRPIEVVQRTDNVEDDIEICRTTLLISRFDDNNCAKGLKHLANYRKQWNDRLGKWSGPRHDEASHGADAFRTGAVGFKPIAKVERRARRGGSGWRDY